jgi:opacity protein-like surface antigen
MRLRLAAVAGASVGLVGLPALAQTAPAAEIYSQVNLGSGVGGSANGNVTPTGSSSAIVSGDFSPKPGIFVSGTIGVEAPYGLALEAEGIYANNNVQTDALNSQLNLSVDASSATWGAMGNLIYRMKFLGPVEPYIGVGGGYGRARYEALGLTLNKDGLMWQARAGVSYPVYRKVWLELGYRYLNEPELHFDNIPVNGTNYSLHATTRLHTVTAGVRVYY